MALTGHTCRASTRAELCEAAVPGVQGKPDASHPAAHGLPVLHQAPGLLPLRRPHGPLPLDCCGAGFCTAMLRPSWEGERWQSCLLPVGHSRHCLWWKLRSILHGQQAKRVLVATAFRPIKPYLASMGLYIFLLLLLLLLLGSISVQTSGRQNRFLCATLSRKHESISAARAIQKQLYTAALLDPSCCCVY